VGPFYRRFIRRPVTGIVGSIGLDGQNDTLAMYGLLNLASGSTRYHLGYREGQASDIVEGRLASFFRLGVSLDLGWIFIQRATTGAYMNDLGIGAGLLLVTEPY